MGAKNKNQVELIPMSKCLQSLEELNTRLSGLFNILPHAIDYIKANSSGKPEHQKYLITTLEDHFKNVLASYDGITE